MSFLRNFYQKYLTFKKDFIQSILSFGSFIIGGICLVNFTYVVIYLIPKVRITHAFISSDLYQFGLTLVGLIIWIVIMVVKRPSFSKGFIALFGPLSLVVASTRFIYIFHTTRNLFSDVSFFKFFGFLIYHSYTKEEYLRYGFSYFQNHNAPSSLYAELSSLYDTHCVVNISDWNVLLDFLLSRPNNFVDIIPLSMWDQLLNFTSSCTSFVVSHPYLIISSFAFSLFLGIGYTVWYKPYFSTASSPTTVNPFSTDVMAHIQDVSKVLIERDAFVLSEARLALSNNNILHSYVKTISRYSIHLFKAFLSVSLFILDKNDGDGFRKTVESDTNDLIRMTPDIIKISNNNFSEKSKFPGTGIPLGHGPQKLDERAARLARFERGLNPIDSNNNET